MNTALSYKNVSFRYPGAAEPALVDTVLDVPEGAFALLTGATGSGKTTLLRLAKPEVAPSGELAGEVEVFGVPSRDLSSRESARACGLVFQNPDAQIVCDSVWHEMSFGLENLGMPEPQMRRRVALTCNYFGIEPWFRRRTAELSGGQRQVLALAATLAMRPRLLLLDEPTSMLDPLAEKRFLSLLFRANRELGVTVVVATHAPWAMVEYATCAFEVVNGCVRPLGLDELAGVPAPAAPARKSPLQTSPSCIDLQGVWQRYDRDARWVLRGLDLKVRKGEVMALVGANASGKSTLLKAIAGIEKPERGRVRNTSAQSQALLPQNPKTLLGCETVREELMEWSRSSGAYGLAEADAALERLGLVGTADRHPYDLSGGQQQLLALEKLLLLRPRLLLLDEPTKGLDTHARERVAARVAAARDAGATVIVATHDLGFVRVVADRVALLFDGQVAACEPVGAYFEDAWPL